MFDYYNETRFQIARLISEKKEIQLTRVLTSTNVNQLGLDFVDTADLIIELEKLFQIEIAENVSISSVDDLVNLVYKNTLLN